MSSSGDIEIRDSGIAGRGVFALRRFRKGDTVFRWDVSRKIRRDAIDALPPEERHFLNPFDDDYFVLVAEPERYVNHSCANNTRVEHFTDVAVRDILPGEEITSDYRSGGAAIDFVCRCGAPGCISERTRAMPEIRILGAGDDAVLADVAPDVFDNALDPALVSEFLHDERHHLAVAIEQGQLIGFASGVHYVHPDKPAELFINEVAVAPSHHRRGIGKAVVDALLQHATRLGCREAWVLTDRDNQAAMRLYASTGGDPGPNDHVMFTFVLKHEEGK